MQLLAGHNTLRMWVLVWAERKQKHKRKEYFQVGSMFVHLQLAVQLIWSGTHNY